MTHEQETAPAPAIVAMDRIANLMRSGHFAPALIQRHFEWTREEAHLLLDNIERAHQRVAVADQDRDHDGAGDVTASDSRDLVQQADDTTVFGVSLDVEEADIAAPQLQPPQPLGGLFIGTIILRRAGVNHHEIYDGLQRFTTLTVLMSVLRDMVEDVRLKRRLDDHVNGLEGGRLSLFGSDRTLDNHVQKPGATLRTTRANAHFEIGRRILYVKNAIRERVAGWDEARRVSFANFLMTSVWVSVLTVPDQRMAQEMFVTTNLYGKPLDVIDVLKGQLVDLLSQASNEGELGAFTDFWNSARIDAGASFTDALRAFDAIERREIQGASWPTDLGLHVASYYSSTGIARFQRRLRAHLQAWKECRRILAEPGASKLEQDFSRLQVFWWPEWHPLALKWWLEAYVAKRSPGQWETKKRVIASRFNRLHRRCMALTLARFSEADRQKIFRNALVQDHDRRDVFTGALSLSIEQRRKIDRTLRAQIHDKDVWAPLTRWLEMSRWREDLPSLIPRSNTEHIRPRAVKWDHDADDDMGAYNDGCFSLGN
ncbi:MAG: DUF262 domain-containing protein, partial [Alphaproteobacteria bacterium]|nr:DUF262 domain-containing protein [Alphaproteobacteria bacterium]